MNFDGQINSSTKEETIELTSKETEVSKAEIPLFNYGIINNEVYYNNAGEIEKYSGSLKATEQIKGLVEIKETLISVIEIQRSIDYSQEEFQLALNKLNDRYDSFVSSYGSINK